MQKHADAKDTNDQNSVLIFLHALNDCLSNNFNLPYFAMDACLHSVFFEMPLLALQEISKSPLRGLLQSSVVEISIS